MRLFAPVITLALLVIGGCSRADTPKAPEQAPTVDRAWVELTDRGAEARLITATAACPAASIDGKLAPMTLRAGPSADFPLTVCQLPSYAHELNPVELVWSHLKRSLANLAKRNLRQLTALVKTRLKRMQYRPGLLDSFLASTLLDLTPLSNPHD